MKPAATVLASDVSVLEMLNLRMRVTVVVLNELSSVLLCRLLI